jgi:hypothetical protein
MDNIKKLIKKHSSELFKKQGVVIVGRGNKIVKGENTGKPAIVVGVKAKLPLVELATEDVVPRQISGVDVDVVEVGEIRFL